MDITDLRDGRMALTGTKDELDAASIWARAFLHGVFGPDKGEERYRAIPALAVLLAYREHVAEAPVC
jgi:hypothetical protein